MTAPSASFAIFPVSKEIGFEPTWLVTLWMFILSVFQCVALATCRGPCLDFRTDPKWKKGIEGLSDDGRENVSRKIPAVSCTTATGLPWPSEERVTCGG